MHTPKENNMSIENETKATSSFSFIDKMGAGESTAFAKNMAAKEEARKFFADHPNQLTLDNLVESGLDIFVRNNLDRGGRIAIDFTINGRKQVINIPNTWIAIRLNDWATHRDIGSSGSLRDHLRKRSIVLVHPDTAEKEYATPRGQRELQKFQSDMAKAADVKAAPILAPRPDHEVSDRMKALVIDYQAQTSDAGKVAQLDKIYSNTRTFNLADIAYFQEKCQGDSKALEQAAEMMIEVETRLQSR